MTPGRRKEIEALRDALGDSLNHSLGPAFLALDDLLTELDVVTAERDGVLARRARQAAKDCPLSGEQLLAVLNAANGKTVTAEAHLVERPADTIRSRRSTAMRKLRTRSIAHAVAVALASGWIKPDDIEIPERWS